MKETKQSIAFPLVLIALVLLLVVFLAVSNFRISQKRVQLNAQIESLQQEISDLQAKKFSLEVQTLQSSQESYLEQEARERFNLKKPGEQVVTVLPPEKKENTVPEETKKWWNPFSW